MMTRMHRNVRLLYLHNLLTNMRFQAPFALIYFHEVTGSFTWASAVLATETIAAGFLDIPTGVFSDFVGRRRTFLLGSLSYALSLTLYAFAPSVAWLFLGAIMFGVSLALFSGNNTAFLYEALQSQGQAHTFHHVLGRASSMLQIGLCASALVASFIAPHGLRFVFMVGIIPQLLAAGVTFFFQEPRLLPHDGARRSDHLTKAVHHVCTNPRLRLVTLAQAFSNGLGEATFMYSTGFVNALWPVWAVSLYRMMAHISAFLGYWFAGRLLDRLRAPVLLIADAAYSLVSGLTAVLMANWFSPLLYVTSSFSFGVFSIAKDQILQQEFTQTQRATLGSVVSFVGNFVSGLGAIALGLVADHFGLKVAMISGLLMASGSLPIYIKLCRKYF